MAKFRYVLFRFMRSGDHETCQDILDRVLRSEGYDSTDDGCSSKETLPYGGGTAEHREGQDDADDDQNGGIHPLEKQKMQSPLSLLDLFEGQVVELDQDPDQY